MSQLMAVNCVNVMPCHFKIFSLGARWIDGSIQAAKMYIPANILRF